MARIPYSNQEQSTETYPFCRAQSTKGARHHEENIFVQEQIPSSGVVLDSIPLKKKEHETKLLRTRTSFLQRTRTKLLEKPNFGRQRAVEKISI